MSPNDAAAQLNSMCRAFDVRFDGLARTEGVLLGLAGHAIAMFREIDAIADLQPFAAVAGIRSLTDLAILVRWIEPCPKLRIAMWFADDERDRLRVLAGHGKIMVNRGLQPVEGWTPDQIARKRRFIESIRAIAVKAHEPIRAKKGQPVLPSVEKRAEVAPESVELGATFLTLSVMVHNGARAFASDRLVRTNEGMRLVAEAPFSGTLRPLAVTTTCLLLAPVSRVLGIGVDRELDALRNRLAYWPSPSDENPPVDTGF